MLRENEKIDLVPGTKYKIIQNSGKFSYGVDAILLSDFTKAKGKVVDLGTGTGIIPLRLHDSPNCHEIYGVEIQEAVADMAARSVQLNKLEEKIKILHMDLKLLKDVFKKSTIDTITTNPPYMKSGGAIVNSDKNFALSRHEIACNLEDIVSISEYLLQPLGRLYMVHRPNRLVDIMYLLRKYNLEPKYIRFVQAKIDRKPNLILIEAVKDGNPELKFYDPLIIYNDDNTYKDEIYEIYYGKGYKNPNKNDRNVFSE